MFPENVSISDSISFVDIRIVRALDTLPRVSLMYQTIRTRLRRMGCTAGYEGENISERGNAVKASTKEQTSALSKG